MPGRLPSTIEGTVDHTSAELGVAKRRINAILNKITLQKFDLLCDAFVESLLVLTEDSDGVDVIVSIVCEHALKNPRFMHVFARLVGHICRIQEPLAIIFRDLLLDTCNEQLDLDTAARRPRKFLGYIRFWSELFRRNVVERSAVHALVESLLRDANPLSLEALCKMLETVGKDVDLPDQREQLDEYFDILQQVMMRRDLSPRIRFMLRNVMDLRRRDWIPRRPDPYPMGLVSELRPRCRLNT